MFGTYRRKTSLYSLGLGASRVAPILSTPVLPPINDDDSAQVCSCGYVFTGEEEEDDFEEPTSGSNSAHYYKHFESPAETLDRRCTVRADNVFELQQFGIDSEITICTVGYELMQLHIHIVQ